MTDNEGVKSLALASQLCANLKPDTNKIASGLEAAGWTPVRRRLADGRYLSQEQKWFQYQRNESKLYFYYQNRFPGSSAHFYSFHCTGQTDVDPSMTDPIFIEQLTDINDIFIGTAFNSTGVPNAYVSRTDGKLQGYFHVTESKLLDAAPDELGALAQNGYLPGKTSVVSFVSGVTRCVDIVEDGSFLFDGLRQDGWQEIFQVAGNDIVQRSFKEFFKDEITLHITKQSNLDSSGQFGEVRQISCRVSGSFDTSVSKDEIGDRVQSIFSEPVRTGWVSYGQPTLKYIDLPDKITAAFSLQKANVITEGKEP